MDTQQQPAIIETLSSGNGYSIGIATLNAPRSINALSRAMIDILLPQLQQWQRDPEIACVLLRGTGDKVFCAGGDVLPIRNSSLAGDDYARQFFEQEYRLDYLIHVYGKPLLVWGHGVVMGGGLGLMAGASHRVATAQTRLAMPEVGIGLYPDVGGTWFLNRMPGHCGLFLGLTGAAVNASDALFTGLADYCLEHEQWQELLQCLVELEWDAPAAHHAQLSRLLKSLSGSAGGPPVSLLRANFDLIRRLMDEPSLEEILQNFAAYAGTDEWLAGAARSLARACPLSLRLACEQLGRGRHQSLREAFQMEMVLSANCMRAPNFAEGVRALLVDKDRQPKFEPARLQDVSAAMVDAYFLPPWDGDNPLGDL